MMLGRDFRRDKMMRTTVVMLCLCLSSVFAAEDESSPRLQYRFVDIGTTAPEARCLTPTGNTVGDSSLLFLTLGIDRAPDADAVELFNGPARNLFLLTLNLESETPSLVTVSNAIDSWASVTLSAMGGVPTGPPNGPYAFVGKRAGGISPMMAMTIAAVAGEDVSGLSDEFLVVASRRADGEWDAIFPIGILPTRNIYEEVKYLKDSLCVATVGRPEEEGYERDFILVNIDDDSTTSLASGVGMFFDVTPEGDKIFFTQGAKIREMKIPSRETSTIATIEAIAEIDDIFLRLLHLADSNTLMVSYGVPSGEGGCWAIDLESKKIDFLEGPWLLYLSVLESCGMYLDFRDHGTRTLIGPGARVLATIPKSQDKRIVGVLGSEDPAILNVVTVPVLQSADNKSSNFRYVSPPKP